MSRTGWLIVICGMMLGLFLAAQAKPENYFGAWARAGSLYTESLSDFV